MLDQMRRQAEDIVRYYGELNRRISNSGIEGIGKLLEVSKSLELAVGEVANQELEWIGAEIKRLLDELVQMDAELQRFRELKTQLEGSPVPESALRAQSTA